MSTVATALAHPNIALVKYWGKRDLALNLPAVPSLSVTLDRFRTRTTVTLGTERDEVLLDGVRLEGVALERVLRHLDRVVPERPPARVLSDNNFPTAAGLASSSSGFAALTLAAAAAAGQDLDRTRLSVLARQGSGSACRSLWGGWVAWDRGEAADGSDSCGRPVAPREHWALSVVVALVSGAKKGVGSTEGMERSRHTSAYYAAWCDTAQADLDAGLDALARRDLPALGAVMERSTYKMHACMQSSVPPIRYWKPRTVAVLDAVDRLRARGLGAWCTMDAGPNVKILCSSADAAQVAAAVEELGLEALVLGIGGDAALVHEPPPAATPQPGGPP